MYCCRGKNKKNELGQSLIEVLLAMVIFVVGVATIASLFLNTYLVSIRSLEKTQGEFLAREGIEAMRSIRDHEFANLTDGVYGIELTEGKWQKKDNPDITDDKFQRTIEIGGTDSIKTITSTVSWESVTGAESIFFSEHLTDWRTAIEEEI